MSSLVIEYKFNRKNFFLQWMLMTVLGSTIGAIITGVWPYDLVSSQLNKIFSGSGLLVANVIIGYAGQKILQHHIKVSNKWFLMTIIAAIPEAKLFGVFNNIENTDYTALDPYGLVLWLIFIPLFFGLVTGFLQWIGLRRIVRRASHWVWISVLSTFCCLVCTFLAFFFINLELPTYFLIGVSIGAVSGAINGFTLLWLLKKPALIAQ
jgi:hypothetical protein